MSNFKIGVLVVFGAFILIGIVVFAMTRAGSSQNNYNLVVWGSLSAEAFDTLYIGAGLDKSETIKITYVNKNLDDFDTDFVEALAEGKGPDIVILRDDYVYKHRNKLFTIPYKNYNERAFKDKFIEQGEMFLNSEGVIAVPLTVDPLVMYWNRDIFSNNNIPLPPRYWDELYPIVEKVTKKDSNGNVLLSAIALGEWRNITNAKEVLSMTFLQAGNSITQMTQNGLVATLIDAGGGEVPSSQSALNFYTQFSNPTSNYYTWNRSLPTSLNMFLGGNLAMYLGFASELFGIEEKNPNLNYDVTFIPQGRGTPKRIVFGRMNALAITKQSKQIVGAFTAINALTESKALSELEKVTNLPPVRRDMLSINKPTDSARSVFYDSALISKSWIDPNPLESSITFRDMIESITSGRRRVTEAYVRANDELTSQLK